ncbi:MAG: hypothetical protein R3F62_14875 [Planctomycetota bacterium]
MTLQLRHKTVIRPATARPPATPKPPLTACWAGTAASAAVLALLWAFQPSAAAETPGLPALRFAPAVARTRTPEPRTRSSELALAQPALARASLGL